MTAWLYIFLLYSAYVQLVASILTDKLDADSMKVALW